MEFDPSSRNALWRCNTWLTENHLYSFWNRKDHVLLLLLLLCLHFYSRILEVHVGICSLLTDGWGAAVSIHTLICWLVTQRSRCPAATHSASDSSPDIGLDSVSTSLTTRLMSEHRKRKLRKQCLDFVFLCSITCSGNVKGIPFLRILLLFC